MRQRLSIVICGDVDHGKSTIVGRLLADTGSLPQGKLEAVQFEYAHLSDALADERAQGITIDAARVFFKTAQRDYVLIDAPGHLEFLKNMVTGASHAEAALLVIDANHGIRDQTRRHGHLLALLGIEQLVVLVNKMDLVQRDAAVFRRVETDYRDFLEPLQIPSVQFIPVSGRLGENIAQRSSAMSWYDGPTLLEALDRFAAPRDAEQAPFRMPVQDVYGFDTHPIIAGTVDSGTARVGDLVVFQPSGLRTSIRSFEIFPGAAPAHVSAGQASGFTLDDDTAVTRGEIATLAREPQPIVATRLRGSLLWLGHDKLEPGRDYVLKLGTARRTMRVEAIHRVMAATDLSEREQPTNVTRHEIAECTLRLDRALAFDLAGELPATSRFVIVDGYEICGGGIVRAAE